LLSWNIYKAGREGWDTTLANLAVSSHIVLLQEAVTPQLNQFWDARGWSRQMVHAFSNGGHIAGVLSASLVPPVSVCGGREAEPLILLPKSLLATLYPIEPSTDERTSLLVVNLHSVNFSLDTRAYQHQLDEISQLAGDHLGPVVVAGDFNTWSESRLGLLNVWADSLGLLEVSFTPDLRTTFAGRAVDHLYYRDLTLLSSQTRQVDSSDHNPLMARFRLD
jgi:endonuclease/exonuclease/phosphatase (EEP) superfamily protein YafD